MAEQNNTSANTSPKGGLSAESEFHAKFSLSWLALLL